MINLLQISTQIVHDILYKQVKNSSDENNNINECSINSNESYDNTFYELLDDYKRKEFSLVDKRLINEEFGNYQDIILDIKKEQKFLAKKVI